MSSIGSMDGAGRGRTPRGIRSLSGRLVALLLVPLVAAQLLTALTLLDRRSAATEARELACEIELVAEIGVMYAPASIEVVASLGLAEVDRLGVDRAVVAEVLGFSYQPYLTGSRAAVDLGLDHLASNHADVVLPSGDRIGDRVREVRESLAASRASLDAGTATTTEISASFDAVSRLTDEIAATSQHAHDGHVVDPGLGAVGDEVSHLLTLVDTVAHDTTTTALVLGASDEALTTDDLLLAAGAADDAIERFTLSMTPEDAARFAASQEAITRYHELRDELVPIADIRSTQRSEVESSLLFTDPQLIVELADILFAAFDRLQVVGEYTRAELTAALERADAIAVRADADARTWMGLIIIVTMASVGSLILVVTSTVRPLDRLSRRAVALSEGLVDLPPLPLTGPSDVRAVTATFNDVNDVLRIFEAQIRRVSSGVDPRAEDTEHLPGVLGESLRAQVDHLSDMTARLRDSEALSRAIIETAADAIWTVDRRGRILSANAAAERLLHVPEALQVGRSLPHLVGVVGRPDRLRGELEIVRPDGATVDVLVSHSEVPARPEPIHAVFARDISDRKRFEEQLAHQARHDGLTGLPNRLAALEHLEQLVRRAERRQTSVAVLFVDLDGFKSVNDSRGHGTGDDLLREVGVRLARSVRDGEFVARLGGDEFLVVAESIGPDEAAALGERLIRELALPFAHGDDLFTISASVGVAMGCGRQGCGTIDALELVREADVAVYHAKARGRSRVVMFDETLQDAVEATAATELALRQAIADDELVLHYQPVLDLSTGTPWGVEALVRWQRPGHGLLGPDRFVPVAERSSLVNDLGRWVIGEACRTLADWQRDPAHRHLQMAVNISGRHLVEGQLVRDVEDAISRTGADPRSLEIEVTETHLLADVDRANEVLSVLRGRGVRVAVDDFGTGYSSMGYLRQLAIDTLKIDRVFVGRVNDAGYDRTIVEVLVQLGLTLGLDIVAEGVETAAQLEFLRDRRCTRAQGLHVAMPMAVADLEQWLAGRAPSLATSSAGATTTR